MPARERPADGIAARLRSRLETFGLERDVTVDAVCGNLRAVRVRDGRSGAQVLFGGFGPNLWFYGDYRCAERAFPLRLLRAFAAVTKEAEPESQIVVAWRSGDAFWTPLRARLTAGSHDALVAAVQREPDAGLSIVRLTPPESALPEQRLWVALAAGSEGTEALELGDGTRVAFAREALDDWPAPHARDMVWCLTGRHSPRFELGLAFAKARRANPSLAFAVAVAGAGSLQLPTHRCALATPAALSRSLA